MAGNNASSVVIVLNAAKSLRAIKADLERLLAASTQPALSKRLESTLKHLRKAIGEFDDDHRGRVTAVVFISSALRDLEDIMDRGLLNGPTAQSLLRRLTGVSWLLAMQEQGDAATILQGNAAAAAGRYSTASSTYWKAINRG